MLDSILRPLFFKIAPPNGQFSEYSEVAVYLSRSCVILRNRRLVLVFCQSGIRRISVNDGATLEAISGFKCQKF